MNFNIPLSEQNFLFVCGIFSDATPTFGDSGIHLRWSLPPSKGIPDGINIYRREFNKDTLVFISPASSGQANFPLMYNKVIFSGSLDALSLHSSGKHYHVTGNRTSEKKLRITFPEQVSFCRVSLGDYLPLTAIAYFPDGSIAYEKFHEGSSTRQFLEFKSYQGRLIKEIEIPLNFRNFFYVAFESPSHICANSDWTLIGNIDNVTDINNNKLFERITLNTVNHYIKNDIDRIKYTDNARRYASLLQAIMNPVTDYFEADENYPSVLEIPPDQLQLKNLKETSPIKLNAWNLLMLGSIDPNNARLLGLYWVDSENNIDNQKTYDYKIEAIYSNKFANKPVCGLLLNIGGVYTPIASLSENLHLKQGERTWWEFDNKYNFSQWTDLKSSWLINSATSTEAINPVIYELSETQSDSRLILPDIQENIASFSQKIEITSNEKFQQIVGIDIFGRNSSPISNTIQVINKNIPPPPSNLQFIQEDNSIFLQYEYGGMSYLLSPNVYKFQAYKKTSSIYSENKKYKYDSCISQGSNQRGRIYRISMTNPIDSNLNFESISFVEDEHGNKLPASKRKKFEIINYQTNYIEFINSIDFSPPQSGYVILRVNPQIKTNAWSPVTAFASEFVTPIPINVVAYRHFIENSVDELHVVNESAFSNTQGLECQILNFSLSGEEKNQDIFVHDTDQTTEVFTKIFIDRIFNESDICTNGKIHLSENVAVKIISQNAGFKKANTPEENTILYIEGHPNITINQLAYITLPKISNNNKLTNGYILLQLGYNKKIADKNLGEILLSGLSASNEQRNITLQILSGMRNISINNIKYLQVLARTALQVKSLDVGGVDSNALFFEPYRVDITQDINQMSVREGEAFSNGYFAVSALDQGGNESLLSSIAQFIKTRSVDNKPAKPDKPFPCGSPNATEAYLRLPNIDGHSVLCISWRNRTPALRYEIGRTISQTVLSVHRNLWLNHEVPDPNGYINASIAGSILSSVNVNQTTGVISIVAEHPAFSQNLPSYQHGRMMFGGRHCFEIVNIITGQGNIASLLLRPCINGAITQGTWEIAPLPDYKTIQLDPAQVVALAELCPSAFSLVTAQPLRQTNIFYDDVPCLGSSFYLYKLRAVDASENRSEWSNASIPVWQVDTRVPDAPIITVAEGQEQQALIKWKNEHDKQIIGYRIYRTNKKVNKVVADDYATEMLIATLFKNPDATALPVAFAKIRMKHGKIYLPAIKEIENQQNQITAIYRLDATGEPEQDFNYLITHVTELHNQQIINLPPSIYDNARVIVILRTNTDGEYRVMYNDAGSELVTSQGELILPIVQDINSQDPIKGIFNISQYQFGKNVEEQIADNHVIKKKTQHITSQQVLKNFHAGLIDNELLAIEITQADGGKFIIKNDVGEYEYTDFLVDQLTPDLFYNYRMEAIKHIQSDEIIDKLYSGKSKDALVSISMKTPPTIPDAVDMEWWDWENDVSAVTPAAANAIRIYNFSFPEGFGQKVLIEGDLAGFFIEIEDNNVRKGINDQMINQLVVKIPASTTVSLRWIVSDYWGNSIAINLRKAP